MHKDHARIRLDEKNFTDLVKGKEITILSGSVQVDMILAEIGYVTMLDILETTLDGFTEAGASLNWENRKVEPKKDIGSLEEKHAIKVVDILIENGLQYSGEDKDKALAGKIAVSNMFVDDLDEYMPSDVVKVYQYLQSENYNLRNYY